MPDQEPTRRPERLLEIVTGALECAPGTRGVFLDAACGGDAALRTEAESLLSFDEPARAFIARPAIALHAGAFLDAGTTARPAATLQPGQMLGDFRVDSLLGEGGMGEVYLAEDTNLGRLVAIKLVKAHLASQTLLRRFEQEKRILAALNDPHIARLYGGGATPEGLPYLVMEYVEGERLDDYCDKRRLPIEERLGLFRKVCAAVAYAHQHLVIHRDLKPANIRVTPEGEPKLLDFGIAKLLDARADEGDGAVVTQHGGMTPGYASPEQLRREPVTTATDIYSLGVVLYELLCGNRPFAVRNGPLADLARAAGEETILRPSGAAPAPRAAEARGTTPGRMSRRLAGDLDNIVLLAMRPEPARRYPSVSQFSDDIRRHLDGQPVSARKETLRYVAAKFVSRNRALAAAAALALLALVGGIVATSWQARRADAQRLRADRRFDDVRRLADSLMGEINDSVQTLAGSVSTQKLIVARALEYLDELGRDADTPALRLDLATAYQKIGDVQGNKYYANLGDTDGARASYRKAEALLRSLAGARATATVAVRMALGRIERALGDIDEVKGDYAGMMRAYRDSLEVFTRLAQERPADPAVLDELARAHGTLGDGFDRTENGQAEQARCFARALACQQKLVELAPESIKYRRGLAVILMKLGCVTLPDKAHGVGDVSRAAAIIKTMSEEHPDNVQLRRTHSSILFRLGWAQAEVGDREGSLASRQQSVALSERNAAADPKDEQATLDLATARTDLAEALTGTGQAERALDPALKAVSGLETLLAADPGNSLYARNIGLFYKHVGNAHAALAARESLDVTERLAHWAGARTAYETARRLFSELKARGIVRAEDSDMLEKLAANTATCDAETARLKSQ